MAVSNAQHTDILPGEAKILYEQSTQTDESKRAKAAAAESASGGADGSTSTAAGTNTVSIWDSIADDERDEIIHERDDLRTREVELLTRIRELTGALALKEADEARAQEVQHRELSKVEQEKIESSEEFHDFFNKSTKIIERLLGYESMVKGYGGTSGSGLMSHALSQGFDFMEDYSADDTEERRTLVGTEGKLLATGVFFIEGPQGTTNRPISSIDWSEKYPELLCASYAPLTGSAGFGDEFGSEARGVTESWDQDGSVLVWNMHMAKRPEYNFTCQSAIHTAQFHPAHPKLIVGGCENGQLLIWDMRQNKSTPVNRSSLSHGHTHPVFSLQIQSLNSGLYQLVSCSSDGQVCVWTENNLHRPVHDVQLVNMRSAASGLESAGVSTGTQDITTTMFDIPGRDTNSIILGSDEGKVYKARLHDPKENERIYEVVHAHDAPMTSIQFHPSMQSASTASTSSDLYLTSSYDWTVKVWSNKLSRPLYTFETARDYVYSASWCPSNPYLFAAGDGTGRLDLYSIHRSVEESEVPILSLQVGNESIPSANSIPSTSAVSSAPSGVGSSDSDSSLTSSTPSSQRVAHAISKIKWNQNGTRIAAGQETHTHTHTHTCARISIDSTTLCAFFGRAIFSTAFADIVIFLCVFSHPILSYPFPSVCFRYIRWSSPSL